MIFIVTLTDPLDPDYLCEYTVEATTPEAAAAFSEEKNPGKVCTGAVEQS